MKELQKIAVENAYSGSNWNFEKTIKYIFEINGNCVEAGYFEHYKDDSLIKAVIELPQSYGCPAKCQFCASAAIENVQPLGADTLEEMFQKLYDEYELEKLPYVLLAMTGIGDIFFNYDNVEEFLFRIKKYENLYVTLSSCLWNQELLTKVDQLAECIKIRNIQITYITGEKTKLEKIVPFYQGRTTYPAEIFQYIEDSRAEYYRVNYIMIKDLNDSEEEFNNFCSLIERVKDKIVVRISKLNVTGTTKQNKLKPTEISRLEYFHSLLQKKNINSYIFYASKNDNMNCGQLITEGCKLESFS